MIECRILMVHCDVAVARDVSAVCIVRSLALYWCYIMCHTCDNLQWVQGSDALRHVHQHRTSCYKKQKAVNSERKREFTHHAARLAAHLSSINCNLSPSPSKNVVCNSDPVQPGTIEAWVAPSIVNTFHVPVTNPSATECDGWAKAEW